MRVVKTCVLLAAAITLVAAGFSVTVCGVYLSTQWSMRPEVSPIESATLVFLFVLLGLGTVRGACDVIDALRRRR